MKEPVVEFDEIVFCYDRVEVLHGVSFALKKEEVVGLLGPNGAGLKASTRQSTLEDVFRTLTHSESTDPGVSRNYRGVHWFYTFRISCSSHPYSF